VLVVLRPRLWVTAVHQAIRLARPQWWRRWPPLPVPDAAYLRFRFETQYGSSGRAEPRDVVRYLEWCHEMERAARGGGSRR